MRPKGIQIDQIVGQANWKLGGQNLPATGNTVDISTYFNNLTDKFAGGTKSQAGIFTTNISSTSNNRIYVRLTANRKAIQVNNQEIYARLTNTPGSPDTWTLTFYVGNESAVDFSTINEAGAEFDFRWCEAIQFGNAEAHKIVDNFEGIDELYIDTDVHKHKREEYIVGTDIILTEFKNLPTYWYQTGTISLSFPPNDLENVLLSVNGLDADKGTWNAGTSKVDNGDYDIIETSPGVFTLYWDVLSATYDLKTTPVAWTLLVSYEY